MTASPGEPEAWVGRRIEVEVGPVAHGGHFVARVSTGLDQQESGLDQREVGLDQREAGLDQRGAGGRDMVVFVRHALPGERVRVEITEESGSFLRADAVEIASASPHRVVPPCPYAGPGACGGCDFQHVDLAEQRSLKAAVVSEQLSRLAYLEREVVVEPVPGDVDGLRWRTRMQYVHLPGGDRGLRKHRSHDVVVVDDCRIAHPAAREPEQRGSVLEQVEAAGQTNRFSVRSDGFWQVHPGAPRLLVETVLSMLAPREGERVADLYAGVGLFSAFLAGPVGAGGRVTAVESDRRAADLALRNLRGHPQVSVVQDRVDRWLRQQTNADLVLLDPPRAGAKRQVVRGIVALAPRAVAYVACDPSALARDLGYFAELGYRLADLRAFDLFPMTHHVECVALLVDPRRS